MHKSSFLENLFHIKQRQSSIKVEFLGGLTTFLAMSYIIFVHPNILSLTGMDKNALITTTCLTAAFGSILMGLLGNVPIALAPGMGLNAFFTFTLVLGQGLPWQTALGVVFLSGLFFLFFTVSGIRKNLIQAIPTSLIIGATAGIGLFISFIGLKNMGLIVAHPATLIGLGKFTPSVLLGLFGLSIMIILEIFKVRGSLLVGILMVTIFGMASKQVQLPSSLIALPPSIAPIVFKLDILGALKLSLLGPIFSFMFVDLFDSLAMLLSCTKQIGQNEAPKSQPNLNKMLYADVTSTIVGSLLGTSTVTGFSESVAGIAVGAKTGFASLVTGTLFLLALFLSPIISVVPMFATAPALVMVGIFMFKSINMLDLGDKKNAIVAFITMIFMPLTYSISTGLSFGFIAYALVQVMSGERKTIHPILWCIVILSAVNLAIL